VAELGGRGNVQGVLTAVRLAAQRLGLAIPEPAWYFPGVAEYAPLLESAGLEVRFATLFDRPTPLEGPEGMRNWVRVFSHRELALVPEPLRDAFLAAVEEAARPDFFRDGGWLADYRRLRVVAVRTAGLP
jgi:hypothetical protein